MVENKFRNMEETVKVPVHVSIIMDGNGNGLSREDTKGSMVIPMESRASAPVWRLRWKRG